MEKVKCLIIGSGPAGLTAANQLNRRGYEVTVFEKYELPGGLLRFGIPNFKLGKNIIDRRIRLMEQEGIVFKVNTMVGNEVSAKEIASTFDAVCIAIGSEVPRDLPIEGRNLKGVHFALELLSQQTQIEIMPQPPVGHNPTTPWPLYPQVLKTSSSHEEGCIRRWNLASVRFIGEKNTLKGVEVEEVEWLPAKNGGRPEMWKTGRTEIIEADLVFLAMGFIHPEQEGLIKELSIAVDTRGNIAVDPGTNRIADTNIFASGDAVSGASLVVRAMASGRKAAAAIDKYLHPHKS